MNDIQPTMDDSQVMDFISRGTVILEGVVSDEFNRQCETLPGRSINEFARTTRISERSPIAPGSRWCRSLAARTGFLDSNYCTSPSV